MPDLARRLRSRVRTRLRDLTTAWRRQLQVRGRPAPAPPDLAALRAAFAPLLDTVRDDIARAEFLQVDGARPPWTATGIVLEAGQEVSLFAAGRLWRSRPQDLWLRPQFALWCRLGETGTVFNSTQDTNSFVAAGPGELYLATQFPGQFGDPSGRVQSSLHVYDAAEGGFAVLVVVWRAGAAAALQHMAQHGDPFGLVSMELRRRAQPDRTPPDWHFLWFLGISDIFAAAEHHGAACIHCRTRGNVGILQKEVTLPLVPGTELRWDWIVTALPSRLREDTSASHDYLSIAVEFENGRDITYHWSWELPAEYGYWCPLPTWADREFHVVIRSGPEGLGTWLSETRDLFADYRRYLGPPPARIVRVWLIAGSRWQRHEGDMQIANIAIASPAGTVAVL